jgi:hypothetical protein
MAGPLSYPHTIRLYYHLNYLDLKRNVIQLSLINSHAGHALRLILVGPSLRV